MNTPKIPDEADLATATVEHLLAMCDDGNEAACIELDRRGVEPAALEPTADLLPTPSTPSRADALAMIALLAGRTIVGVQIDEDRTASVLLEGGSHIVLHPDGELSVVPGPATLATDQRALHAQHRVMLRVGHPVQVDTPGGTGPEARRTATVAAVVLQPFSEPLYRLAWPTHDDDALYHPTQLHMLEVRDVAA